MERIFTSESVTEGHPDKMADRISDAVLDAILERDPTGRVACETLVTTGMVLVAGEIKTSCYVDIPYLVRNVVREIGYVDAAYGFDAETCAVITSIDQQSPDIALGVDRDGAGDQGLMFGYACRETEELMPLPIMLAHQLARRLAEVRKNNVLPWLRPDGKTQVSVCYRDWRPVWVTTVVVSAQHDPEHDGAPLTAAQIKEAIVEEVIKPIIPEEQRAPNIDYKVNPTGRFVMGGPQADCGLTGRKVIVDTYGGMARHGGGCFSGKDPTKVDRSAAYAARHAAKNIVAAGLADRCELQVAYAIGESEPVSLAVETYGTARIPEEEIVERVRKFFDFRPRKMIERLQLRRPIYQATSAYGHFGRSEPGFTWELTDMVDALRS